MTEPTQPAPPEPEPPAPQQAAPAEPPAVPTGATQPPAVPEPPTPEQAAAAAPAQPPAVPASTTGPVPPVPPPAGLALPPGEGPPPPGARTPIYSMVTTFDETVTMSRLWGIPILGIAIRGLLLIPHYIVLAFYGVLVVLLQLVVWIPVLFGGRYPAWGYSLVGGYVRWLTRVQAYLILAASAYPPLSTGGRHDVTVEWDPAQAIPRWAGIPILGVLIRVLLLIPHFVILWLLGIVVGILGLVTWIPVLLNGRYAAWAYLIVGGYMRWQNRIASYVLLMTGPYPPFSIDD